MIRRHAPFTSKTRRDSTAQIHGPAERSCVLDVTPKLRGEEARCPRGRLLTETNRRRRALDWMTCSHDHSGRVPAT